MPIFEQDAPALMAADAGFIVDKIKSAATIIALKIFPICTLFRTGAPGYLLVVKLKVKSYSALIFFSIPKGSWARFHLYV